MTDIVEELRNRTTGIVLLSDPPQYQKDGLCQRAADEIDRLRAENEKLRAKLDGRDQFIVENGLWSEFTKQVDKLTSAAAAALKETGDDHD